MQWSRVLAASDETSDGAELCGQGSQEHALPHGKGASDRSRPYERAPCICSMNRRHEVALRIPHLNLNWTASLFFPWWLTRGGFRGLFATPTPVWALCGVALA